MSDTSTSPDGNKSVIVGYRISTTVDRVTLKVILRRRLRFNFVRMSVVLQSHEKCKSSGLDRDSDRW